MKIFLIDWNNMTPQYTFPLIHSMQSLNIFFITNTKSNDDIINTNYNVNIIDIFLQFSSSFKTINKISKPFILCYNYLLLLYQIKKIKPEIIHYNWISIPLIDLMFIKILKFLKLKILLTQHNYYQHSKKQLRFGENSIFNAVDKIFCLSNYVKNQFNDKYKNKISIIPHRNCYEHLLKKKHNKKTTTIINLLLIGNIKNYKGIELMIDVFKYFKRNKTKIHLKICGPGNASYIKTINNEIIRHNLKDMITLKNKFLSFDSLCDYINNCDIGLLPYKRASQSGIPYLFYFYNKPLVVTNVGGLIEQVDTSFCNISEYNVEKFSNNIINMVEKIKTNKINTISFQKFLNKNAWKKTINEYSIEYKKYENPS